MQKNNKKPLNKKEDVNLGQKNVDGEHVAEAHDEALSDIDKDPDFSLGSPNDDLDEGETARLGEDKADLV